EGLQRLEDLRQFELRAGAAGRPAVHHRAMRKVEEAETRIRRGSRLRQRGTRRNHRIEQRQRDPRPQAADHGTPGKVFPRYEHVMFLQMSSRGSTASSRGLTAGSLTPAFNPTSSPGLTGGSSTPCFIPASSPGLQHAGAGLKADPGTKTRTSKPLFDSGCLDPPVKPGDD